MSPTRTASSRSRSCRDGNGATAVLLATAHLANDALTGILPALLPALGQRLDIDGSGLALLVAVFALSTSLPQPMLGGLGSASFHPAGMGMVRHVTGTQRGPVGVLTLAGMLAAVASTSFTGAVPLWLVDIKGVPADSAIIGWTLAAFSAASAARGVLAGAPSKRVSRRGLTVGSLLLSLVALQGVVLSTPGRASFFGVVALVVAFAGVAPAGIAPAALLAGAAPRHRRPDVALVTDAADAATRRPSDARDMAVTSEDPSLSVCPC